MILTFASIPWSNSCASRARRSDRGLKSAPPSRYPARSLAIALTLMAANSCGAGGGGDAGTTTAEDSGTPIVRVSTLADSGPGSLREAVSQGGRTVIFDVAGTISLQSVLVIGGPSLTIDGSSAPAPGITLHDAGILLDGPTVHDVVLQNLRIRAPGRNYPEGDGITIKNGVHHVVVDHVSVDGCADGNIDITQSAHDVTVQWSVLSNCAKNMLINYGAQRVSLHHNIWVDSQWRNPNIQFDDAATAMAPDTTADFRNNIVWNWGDNGGGTILQCGAKANVVNNFYFSGATIASRKQNGIVNDGCTGGSAQPSFYTAGNVSGDDSSQTLNSRGNVVSPFAAAPVDTQSTCAAAREVLVSAGASPRDAVDSGHLGRISLPSC